ncbi:MAG: endopeptidase [Frankiaceae bacterium]|jgi:STE24 endopeptidase|nr:endopeptidase [Frankiaceae bacterium]
MVALVSGLLLSAALGVVLAATTPWRPLGDASTPTPVDWQRDFSAAEHAREQAFHSAVRPPAYLGLALALLAVAMLGFTPWGARLVDRISRPLGGWWGWRVLLAVLVFALVQRLVTLPTSIRAEQVLRDYGLSTQSWGTWAADMGKGMGVSVVITSLGLLPLVWVARRLPDWWWAPAAVGSALLVLVVSFGYPVVIEPLFNKFTPLPAGELRTSLLDLAAQDHVKVDQVLVADASRRTNSLNAYVSGFGATKRIVVYDTLLTQATPQEVRLVVAHELGHAKRKDVLHGTLIGALAGAAGLCLLGAVLGRRMGDPRTVPLLLAIIAFAGFAISPLMQLVSRHVEARADVHSLDLTHDPTTFIASERRLAMTNLSDLDPNPLIYALFASHPTGPQRIATARDWALAHHVPAP